MNRNWWTALLPVLMVTVFLSPALLTGFHLFPGDLIEATAVVGRPAPVHNPSVSDAAEQFFPYLTFLRSEVAAGRLPLWNPYVLNGTPFVATTVSAALSPLTWLLLWLPPVAYFEWAAWLKMSAGALGMYVLAVRLGLSPGASTAAVAAWVFSGYWVYFLLFPNTLVTALIPWALLLIERWVEQPRRRDLGMLGFVLAVSWLAGHVESALLLNLACGVYGAVRAPRRWLALAGVQVLGALAAGVLLLPFADFLFQSFTLVERSAFPRNPFRVHPSRWVALVLPYAVGSPVVPPQGPLPARVVEGAVYLGVVPLFLAAFSAAETRLRSQMAALAALALAAGTIVFGIPPVFDVFTAFPVLRSGNHFHAAQILLFALSLMAGIGLDRVAAGSRRFWTVGGVFAGLLALACLRWLDPAINPDAAGRGLFFIWTRLEFPAYLVWAAAAFGVGLGLCRLERPQWAMAGLLAACGMSFGMFYNPLSAGANPDELRVEPLSGSHERAAVLGIGTLPPNLGMLGQIRDVRGYESVRPARIPDLYRALGPEAGAHHHFMTDLDAGRLRLLRRLGCSWVLSDRRVELEGLVPEGSGFPWRYRVEGGARVVWASRAVDPRPDMATHLGELEDSEVVLEGTGGGGEGAAAEGRIGWLVDEPDRVELEVEAPGEGWLVLRDTWAKGWTVRLDGEPAALLRADYLFRAVRVGPGTHRVEFRYGPVAFRWGLGFTAVGLAGLLILVGWPDRRGGR
jgi:hypothetical protein